MLRSASSDRDREQHMERQRERYEMGAGELSAIVSGESPDQRSKADGGARSPDLKSLQRGLLNDVPTDSLDLQQLVRTGERTKVWRACWRDTGEQVTVKAIDVGSAELELDLKDDLRREVDSLRDCRHPNIVSFHLSYVDEGRLWVVMAYHHAVSIRELLSSGLTEFSIRYVCTAVRPDRHFPLPQSFTHSKLISRCGTGAERPRLHPRDGQDAPVREGGEHPAGQGGNSAFRRLRRG